MAYVLSPFSSGNYAGSIFISEPVNVTVNEGESITINCSSTMNEFFAIWIIDGRQYLWSEFENLEMYTFNQLDNALTINHSPRSLDGTSFQCVINRQESRRGYLTILYSDDIVSTVTLASAESETKVVTDTPSSTSPTFTRAFATVEPGMFIV